MLSGKTEAKEGLNLKETVSRFCLVQVNGTTLAMIGGWTEPDGSGGKTLGKTWFFHINSEPWQQVSGPNLGTARRWHSCGTFEVESDTFQVAAGGRDAEPLTSLTSILECYELFRFCWTILMHFHKVQSCHI